MDTQTARRRLTEEREHLVRLQAEESEVLDDAQPDDIGEYAKDPAYGAQETSTREIEQSVVSSLGQQLDDIDAALRRLDDGTYGRCEVCGRQIDEDRLDAAPATRFCLEHQEQAERQTRAGEWNP